MVDDNVNAKDNVPPDRGKQSVRSRPGFAKSPLRPSPYNSLSSKSSPKPLNKDKYAKFSKKDFLHSNIGPQRGVNVIKTNLRKVKSSRNLSASDLTDPLEMPRDILIAMKKTQGILSLQEPSNPMDCSEAEKPAPSAPTKT